MSVTTTVLLERSRMPTPASWSSAIRSDGFELALPPELTLDNYLPCTYRAKPAGFECIAQPLSDYWAAQQVTARDERRRQAGARDLAISFVTRSELRDLISATIASAVLAMLADGLVWSDEAGALTTPDEALQHARDLDADPVERAPVVPAAPYSVHAGLRASVAFRGVGTLMIKTIDSTLGQLTLKVDTSALPAAKEVEIVSLWEHPAGRPTVHELRIGGVLVELDPRGAPVGGPSPNVERLIEQLGVVESAARNLIAAGAAAAPGLGAVVANRAHPMHVRRMAVVILGQLGSEARSELVLLESLRAHPDLGSQISRALALICA